MRILWVHASHCFLTKYNRHHVCAEHGPDEVRDEVLAHVRLKHQDKLVESAIKICVLNLKADDWLLREVL